MGFFLILPLTFFSGFFLMFSESFFLISITFLLFIFTGYSYEFFLFYFDLFNWLMLLLTLIIVSFMVISNFSFLFDMYFNRNLLLTLGFLVFSVYLLFFSEEIFMFYIFFEFSIIPIFFLICGWGFNFERFNAAFYMMIYTLFFSLPFLIFLLLIYNNLKTLSILSSLMIYSSSMDLFLVFFSLFMFFVKLPSFFLHLWLPKAHVEAPVIGSMVLAGLLLKLGSYGILIYLPFVFFELFYFTDFIGSWALMGGLFSSIICFRQVDLKKMIAYMSVSHMAILMIVLFNFFNFSFWGIMLMMLAHGFTSSGLFFLLNTLYERMFSRSLFFIKGFSMLSSSMILWFFLLVSSNISAPPSMNFFSELILLFSVAYYSMELVFLMLVLMFFGSICSFHMFVSMIHGSFVKSYMFMELSIREHLILFYHLIPISFSFLFF